MKKYQLLLLLGTLLLTSCSGAKKKTRQEDDPITPAGEDGPYVSDLQESEYNLFTTNYLRRLTSYNTYKAVTSGQTVTKMILGNVTQTIDVTAIKSDYSYQYNASHSDYYSSEHIAYYHSNQAVYKNKGDSEYTKSSLEEYLNKYGVYPFENRIEGYKVTGEAVKSITQLDKDGENYRFHLVLDPVEATNNVIIQMREFGQLDDNPKFSSIEMTLTVQNNYTPVKIELDSKYKAKKFLETDCHQTYTVTFSNYNENIEVPNVESVKGLFN